jgi:predicted NAD/FAD-dependent oxidoreductase/pimeloyl-ACP methyl ester carboxylesterase
MPFVRATDGIRLHYNEMGRRSGPPVLMIQGLAADKHAWTLQRVALASKYRTIALDNRGAGRSDKPYGDYSLEQMALDAVSVLDHAGVDTAHVMGASMGGAITEIIGVRHADRVRSLTLACTACMHHEWRKELLAEWADTAVRKGMGSMTSEAARWVIGPRSFRRLAPAIGWMGPLAFSRPPHAFAGQVAAILSIDDSLSDELSEVSVPTLVIVGNQDILTPRRGHRRSHPHLRARRDQRCCARFDDRARHDLQPGVGRVPRARRGHLPSVGGRPQRRRSRQLMRVAVIGAGLSGLVAARTLAEHHDVVVLDKGVSVGGRLATRRIGRARLDHGAQFFTVRGQALQSQTDDWLERGVAKVWCHGFAGRHDGFPRFCGTGGMNSLAKDLADGLDCRVDRMVFMVRPTEDGWDVVIDDGSSIAADAIVSTCPIPQSWALLAQAELEIPEELFRRAYHRTIGLMTVLDRPSAVPHPGGVQFDPGDADQPFGFIADNQAKGVSDVPAVTFHATQPFSLEHWDDDIDELRRRLIQRARPWIGDADIVEAHVKKWRFAGPVEAWPDPCWVEAEHQVVLAGDLFAGPKFEGAYNSGLAAAAAVDDFT